MSGWAKSRPPKGACQASSAPTSSDWPKQPRSKPTAATINLEEGINRLEEAIARCDTDDAYKSTLELYAVHIQTQRADISALRSELERAKIESQKREQAQSAVARGQLASLRAEFDAREEECAAQRLRTDELSSQVQGLEQLLQQKQEVLNACCEQLSEERKWRKASLECLRNELGLAQDTANLAPSVALIHNKKPAPKNRKGFEFSARVLTEERPRSAPSHWDLEEEETGQRGTAGDEDIDIKVERRCEKGKVITRRA